MSIKSTNDHYGTVAITLHWFSALFIFALIGSGFRASDAENISTKADILQFHIPFGIVILLLTLARIAWWLFFDKKPSALAMPTWQDRTSRIVHFLFYILVLGMGASGIGMIVLSGAGPIIFSSEASTLPDFWNYPPRAPHGIGARIMIILLGLHIGGALYHHFKKKDGIIQRMWFSK